MAYAEVIAGTIKSVQGATPGPLSGISYTINYDTGDGVVEMAGVIPCNNRPAAAFDIDAAKEGTVITGVRIGQRLFWTIIEHHAVDPCPQGPPPPPGPTQDPNPPEAPPRNPPILV